jgi:membrane-associated protease RseP (regulator of RpoE activity)
VPKWKIVAINLSGCAGLAAIGLLVLGTDRGIHALIRGFHQWSPFFQSAETSKHLLRVLLHLTENVSCSTAIGLLSLKVAAVNLLPIPSLNGWGVISAVLEHSFAISYRIQQRIFLCGFLILVITWLAWAVLALNAFVFS